MYHSVTFVTCRLTLLVSSPRTTAFALWRIPILRLTSGQDDSPVVVVSSLLIPNAVRSITVLCTPAHYLLCSHVSSGWLIYLLSGDARNVWTRLRCACSAVSARAWFGDVFVWAHITLYANHPPQPLMISTTRFTPLLWTILVTSLPPAYTAPRPHPAAYPFAYRVPLPLPPLRARHTDGTFATVCAVLTRLVRCARGD